MKPITPLQQKGTPQRTSPRKRGSSTVAALLLGVPLAAITLCVLNSRWFEHSHLQSYVERPVQMATVVLFFCALGTLGVKLLASLREQWIFRILPLPPWNGKAIGVDEAANLLTTVRGVAPRLQNTYLFRRVVAILDFLCHRGSATELDDHVRALLDNDAMSLEASYGLTRFITWAMPILGFLGTVLGITQAIMGVSPEMLEKDLGQVTGGLGEAFNSTALALGLTMVTMFLAYLVEKKEQGLLEDVDHYVDVHLTHRFTRLGADSEPFVAAVRQNAQVLIDASADLVRQQAQIWAETLGKMDKQTTTSQAAQQQQFTAALATALEHTVQKTAHHLAELEQQTLSRTSQLLEQLNNLAAVVLQTGQQQQEGLVQVAGQIGAQANALGQLQEQEKHLVCLQSSLAQNLNVLAGSGAFEEAVQSLTAAIHLLTARAVNSQRATAPPPIPTARGKAA